MFTLYLGFLRVTEEVGPIGYNSDVKVFSRAYYRRRLSSCPLFIVTEYFMLAVILRGVNDSVDE